MTLIMTPLLDYRLGDHITFVNCNTLTGHITEFLEDRVRVMLSNGSSVTTPYYNVIVLKKCFFYSCVTSPTFTTTYRSR